MKQIGFTQSDRDDRRPDPKKGRQNGGRTKTSGGAAGGGKFRNVNLGFKRNIPKFLQKYSHMLGVKPKRPQCQDEIFASKEEFVDREDEQPTIVSQEELGSQPKRKRRAQTIDDIPSLRRKRHDGSSHTITESKPKPAGSAMDRLKAMGLISPAMAEAAKAEADANSKKEAEAAAIAREKALVESIKKKRLKGDVIASIGEKAGVKPPKKKKKDKKKKRRSRAVQNNKLLSFGEF